MRPLKHFGSPVMDALGPMPYCQLNGMLDAAYPKGALNYWKSSFLAQIERRCHRHDDRLLRAMPDPDGPAAAGARPRRGDPGRGRRHGLPASRRRLQLPRALAMDGCGRHRRCIAWARETYAEMQPFVAAGRYVNYLDDDEAGDPVAAAYGPNYRRLQELKTKYDPKNFFRMNQNIRPSA